MEGPKVMNPTKYIKVEFTREERATFALELARKTQHLTELEMHKKQVASAIKAQMEEELALQAKLARFVNDGFNFKEVEIRWILDTPRKGLKTAMRLDTYEFLDFETEAMTDGDRQMALKFEEDRAKAEAEAAKAEEDKPLE